MAERETWTPAFPGQRPPFEPGHELSVKHSAYATVKLAPRAEELADGIRAAMTDAGIYKPLFESIIEALAFARAQLEAASAALEEASPTERARLRQDARGWCNTITKAAQALGLSPPALSRLGLDVASTKRTLSLIELSKKAAQHEQESAA